MTRSYRLYFIAVGLLALWVGVCGYPDPSQAVRALPWSVPPLHARFIAAMYLAGALAMFCSAAARDAGSLRIPLVLATLWTGSLMLISLLHLGAFDFGRPQTWFWMGAYIVYPLWGGWLVAQVPGATPARTWDVPLLVVGAASLVMGAALAVAPVVMTRLWPWSVSPLLANIYAGPLLAYGVCALMLAREPRAEARRITLASLLAFALLTLLASLLHLRLFHFDAPAAWLWFGAFSASALLLSWRLAVAWQSPRGTRTALP
jgi:hypothetical protein